MTKVEDYRKRRKGFSKAERLVAELSSKTVRNNTKRRGEFIVGKHGVKGLSPKAIRSVLHQGYLTVWEGAVRSGKTVASSLAWILFVMTSRERYFIMSGQTVAALYRNVISGDFGMLNLIGSSARYQTDSQGNRVLIIPSEDGDKFCYCFGAGDERSYTKLRGITAGGWYADEINLQPKSFIEEAFRRTIVSSQRRHFWTLNPGNPYHFIYTDFIDKYERMNLPGFKLFHFTLEDNYAISEDRKRELEAQYSGLFYERYILGRRVVAEGAIYGNLTKDNFYSKEEAPDFTNCDRFISVDYGTKNPCVFLEIFDSGDTIYVQREFRWDAGKANRTKTDLEYVGDMMEFVSNGIEYMSVICDPSALSFITALKAAGFFVRSANNDLLNGIRKVSSMFGLGRIKINTDLCPGLMEELRSYSWDMDKHHGGADTPVSMHDHAPDALRYFINTVIPDYRVGEDYGI